MSRKPWADRGSRHARGYGTAWDKLRLTILRRDNHLCVACLKQGRVSPAKSVDHILPKAKGGTDDPANLQSLCDDHGAEKDAADRGAPLRRKRKIGVDGWPAD